MSVPSLPLGQVSSCHGCHLVKHQWCTKGLTTTTIDEATTWWILSNTPGSTEKQRDFPLQLLQSESKGLLPSISPLTWRTPSDQPQFVWPSHFSPSFHSIECPSLCYQLTSAISHVLFFSMLLSDMLLWSSRTVYSPHTLSSPCSRVRGLVVAHETNFLGVNLLGQHSHLWAFLGEV